MAASVTTRKKETASVPVEAKVPEMVRRTQVGWQGIRFALPPDWNVTGFSMDRDNGYLRVDAPGDSEMTLQVRWTNAARPEQKTLYHVLAPHVRRLLKKPEPTLPKPDLKANLEKLLKETAKQAKKSKQGFESSIKPEKIEGDNDERTALNFSWTGQGRGQGKIWYCAHCKRIVVAQIIGLAKDSSAMNAVAAQLFATLQDHAVDGYDLWALYDLEMDVPADFRLESQKLLSGYLNLTFLRGGEKIIMERWGLANITLKKFTLAEWFQNNAAVNSKRLTKRESDEGETQAIRWTGSLPFLARLKGLIDARFAFWRAPSQCEAAIWTSEASNKIHAIQVFTNRRSVSQSEEVVTKCLSR